MNGRALEPLWKLLRRVALDSLSVGWPVTWEQLAGAAVMENFHHPEHGWDVPALAADLFDAFGEQMRAAGGPIDPDWRRLADAVEERGWTRSGKPARLRHRAPHSEGHAKRGIFDPEVQAERHARQEADRLQRIEDAKLKLDAGFSPDEIARSEGVTIGALEIMFRRAGELEYARRFGTYRMRKQRAAVS